MNQDHIDDAPADEQIQNTVDVEIFQADWTIEPEDDDFELARDIRAFADVDVVTPDAFERVYRHACSGAIDLEAVREHESVDTDDVPDIAILEHIYRRCQGGHIDREIGYDGSEMCSLSAGDIVAIDGDAHLCARIGFDQLGDLEELRRGSP